jgi:hypothetical protein
MTRPGLLEGAVVALACSVVGSGAQLLLAPLLGHRVALQIVIAAVALAYLCYLLWRGRARAGRVTVPAAWVVLSAAALLAGVPLTVHLLAQSALVWIARSWCFHRGVLPAAADLGVVAAGLAAVAWALHHGAGLALAIWSLMLVQSLFVLLPSRGEAAAPPRAAGDDDAFDRAHRAACAALQQLRGGA